MSQKPKAGGQARATPVSPVAPKVVMKAEPAKAEPSVEAEPVAKVEPAFNAELAAMLEPMTKPEAAVMAEPVIKYTPVQPTQAEEVESVMTMAIEAAVSAPDTVHTTMAAASDLAAASAEVVSETITATADTVAAATEEAIETASAITPTRSTLTAGMKTMMKSTEDLVAFGQANLEAFVKSGQIWSAGVQELTKQFASTAKASFEESVSTFKAISTAKSVKEAMELQSTFAKSALEKAMAESNKLTDASIKLTEQTLAPITARVTVAVETFGKAA